MQRALFLLILLTGLALKALAAPPLPAIIQNSITNTIPARPAAGGAVPGTTGGPSGSDVVDSTVTGNNGQTYTSQSYPVPLQQQPGMTLQMGGTPSSQDQRQPGFSSSTYMQTWNKWEGSKASTKDVQAWLNDDRQMNCASVRSSIEPNSPTSPNWIKAAYAKDARHPTLTQDFSGSGFSLSSRGSPQGKNYYSSQDFSHVITPDLNDLSLDVDGKTKLKTKSVGQSITTLMNCVIGDPVNMLPGDTYKSNSVTLMENSCHESGVIQESDPSPSGKTKLSTEPASQTAKSRMTQMMRFGFVGKDLYVLGQQIYDKSANKFTDVLVKCSKENTPSLP